MLAIQGPNRKIADYPSKCKLARVIVCPVLVLSSGKGQTLIINMYTRMTAEIEQSIIGKKNLIPDLQESSVHPQSLTHLRKLEPNFNCRRLTALLDNYF